MTIDISNFHKINVADTCAVWNLLSSAVLYQTAISVGCVFSCTAFVEYECLRKPRKTLTPIDIKLQDALRKEQEKERFLVYHLAIEDLLEIDVLENRRKLGKGELSSIAFAKRTNQAILTDDQKARNSAMSAIETSFVQTTPHLVGWMFYHNFLGDSDKDAIILEHNSHNRPLAKFFEIVWQQACEYRLMSQ